MKRYILYLSVLAVLSVLGASCNQDAISDESIIKPSVTEKNEFDYWLDLNFLKPYNIDFHYRYDFKESDMNYYTVPADYNASVIYAHLVKYLCVDTYDEVAGVDFTKAYFPKMFFLIGEWEYRNNGTMVLGTAEGGKKILLSGVNNLPSYLKNYSGEKLVDVLNELYIKTIHHEFTHILNQTKVYQTSFKQITASTYVTDSWDRSDNWLKKGYITQYAQHSDVEDFAELLSTYITNDAEWWNEQLADAGTEGARLITTKMDLVKDYMMTSWGINVDDLRKVILRRTKDVIDGYVNLTDLSIR